jgi:hypothetical protein
MNTITTTTTIDKDDNNNNNQICISNNGSTCLCNKEDETNIHQHKVQQSTSNENSINQDTIQIRKRIIAVTNYCTHSIVFNIGLRSSRKTITLKYQSDNGYCHNGEYKLDRRPTCHFCNHLFIHLEWCTYFWGCIPCFRNIFNTKRKIENLLLCEQCTINRLFYEVNDSKSNNIDTTTIDGEKQQQQLVKSLHDNKIIGLIQI